MAHSRIKHVFYKTIAWIDKERCVKCGRCVKACPLHAISWKPKSYPRIDKKLCIGCTICSNACPVSAIEFRRSISFLPLALTLTVLILSVIATYTLAFGPTPSTTVVETPPSTVSIEGLFEESSPSPSAKVNISYYYVLEEEAGTEGG